MQTLIQEWKKLKPALFVLLIVLLVGAGLVTAAYYFGVAQAEALAKQQGLEQDARLKLKSSGAEKAMIEHYLPEYQLLIQRGFVGEERRIEWVDLLRELQNTHKLFSISYAISQQEDYTPPFISQLGGFIMHRSVMKLDLDMLHEGDILNLTQSLVAANNTPFLLRECEITRINGAVSQQLVANMHAKCELDWLTLREPGKIEVH
jgi:hypothetical protein